MSTAITSSTIASINRIGVSISGCISCIACAGRFGAAGHALLMALDDEEAAEMVSRQGFGRPGDFGPAAPTTIKALLDMLAKHRRRGFCILQNCYAPGMSSMAAPVQRRGEPATAAIVVAGPSIRMTGQRMLELGGDLMSVAAELALLGGASPLLSGRSKGTSGNRGTGV